MTGFNPRFVLNDPSTQTPSAQWLEWVEQQYNVPEGHYLIDLLGEVAPFEQAQIEIAQKATELIREVRQHPQPFHAVDELLLEYGLDTEEGVILMCLAEAMMRVPDTATLDALIQDRLGAAHWEEHLGKSDSFLVNASSWGLLLTGKVSSFQALKDSPFNSFKRLAARLGEPLVRSALQQAMRIMSKQFVVGRNLPEALENSRQNRDKGYTYSFDMLGEAALTDQDAKRYFNSYLRAIETLGENRNQWNGKAPAPSISIKLSALHPRYEQAHEETVLNELSATVEKLVAKARAVEVALTIDAEEMDRLELSLKVFERVLKGATAKGWGQFGLAVQAYSKRALAVLGFLNALGREAGCTIPVRLVKGAYWDSEIKHTQLLGLKDYPVFTRKENTDVSYLVCARFLLDGVTNQWLHPQFATHNALTVASILHLSEKLARFEFEFQRLHGMGEALYDVLLKKNPTDVRVYAPVGPHKDLLPYLVRRLLENGANSSFVHRLVDAKTPVEQLIASPIAKARANTHAKHSNIPLPPNLFGPARINSLGLNLNCG
ncbi:MAG: proline dehydrogenase family protein, partial [Limnobacter sp.]|nr:proline dehydrogenase family protein [Limnobacter sp.]